jgi:hypothetical protein
MADVVRKRRGSMRAVLGKTKNYGTPSEKRAVAKGLEAAAKAKEEGKNKKEADAIGKQIATREMKTNRSKANVEAAWTAATFLPLGIGQTARAANVAYKAGQGLKTLSSATIRKEVARKAAADASKKAAAATKKLERTRGYLAQSVKAKEATKLANATAKNKKAADATKNRAVNEVNKQQKIVTDATKKGPGVTTGQRIRMAIPIAVTAARAASKSSPAKEAPLPKTKPNRPTVKSAPPPPSSASKAPTVAEERPKIIAAPAPEAAAKVAKDKVETIGEYFSDMKGRKTKVKTPFGTLDVDSSDAAYPEPDQYKAGGKVSSSSKYKCSHNSLY